MLNAVAGISSGQLLREDRIDDEAIGVVDVDLAVAGRDSQESAVR